MDERYTNGAKVFKALCDENRLSILDLLKNGEMCACKILEKLEISQSTLSHHLKILSESGIVSTREEGKWTHYSLSREGCETARALLKDFTRLSAPHDLKMKSQCG